MSSPLDDYPESVQKSLRASARNYGITEDEAKRRYEKIVQSERLGIPVCVICCCNPDELSEYTEPAAELNISANEYVRKEEGTFNRQNGHFLCTPCYVVASQPSGPNGWVAP
jgi:hypothetical protein